VQNLITGLLKIMIQRLCAPASSMATLNNSLALAALAARVAAPCSCPWSYKSAYSQR
jgi:hypothetical protein